MLPISELVCGSRSCTVDELQGYHSNAELNNEDESEAMVIAGDEERRTQWSRKRYIPYIPTCE